MFSPTAPPKRIGDYTRFVTKRASTLPPTTGRIVAVPFTDDWGPEEDFVLLESFAEYLQVFGTPRNIAAPSDGYVAVYNAFKGEGGDRGGGAGAVLAYRMTASAAAKATLGLAAGATSPAITLTAKYKGLKGNDLKVAVVANAVDSTNKRDVKLYLGNTLVEEYKSYGSADIASLLADINDQSAWVAASGATNGTKLDVLAATALASGNSGTSLVSGDYTSMMTAFEGQRFGYFAPANLTDTSIQTAIYAWVAAKNAAERSKRFFAVVGGPTGDTYSTASARSAAAGDENVVNFGLGTFHDSVLDLDLNTAQLAPRVAGIMASRGGRSAISFAYMEDLTLLAGTGPTDSEIVNASDDGILVAALGTGGVRFERGVTTWTADTDEKPNAIYGRIKYVTTQQNIERDGKEENEAGDVLGKLNVNDDTREFLVGRETKRLNAYILAGEIAAKDKNGDPARVVVSSDPPPSPEDEFVALDWLCSPERTLEQIRRTVYYS